MSPHALVSGFGGAYFIFTDTDFQPVLYFDKKKKKGGMLMCLAFCS